MSFSICKSCNATIRFVRTENGRTMPVDSLSEKRIILVEKARGPNRPDEIIAKVVDTFVSHFVTCPNRDQHRKPRG